MTQKDILAAFAKSKTSGVPGCPECGVHTDKIPGVGPASRVRPRRRRRSSRPADWPFEHRTIS